jgi:hypothetical protein
MTPADTLQTIAVILAVLGIGAGVLAGTLATVRFIYGPRPYDEDKPGDGNIAGLWLMSFLFFVLAIIASGIGAGFISASVTK